MRLRNIPLPRLPQKPTFVFIMTIALMTISFRADSIRKHPIRTVSFNTDSSRTAPKDIAIPFQNRLNIAQAINHVIETEPNIDLATMKLSIDKVIDPTIDVEGTLKTIDNMVKQIRAMLREGDSSMVKMLILKQYLYHKGHWNNYQPYQYDFTDPQGSKLSKNNLQNKLLTTYLKTKKGNCVTMPLLFVILGEKIGLKVTLSTAPLHYFVKFTEQETGITHNLETTSGAGVTREAWYREQMPMTDKAITNGIYLQPLTKKELIATMVITLAEYYMRNREYNKAIDTFQVTLKHYPKSIYSIVKTASAFAKRLKQEFPNQRNQDQIPTNKKPQYDFYKKHHDEFWATADHLGWKAVSPKSESTISEPTKSDSTKSHSTKSDSTKPDSTNPDSIKTKGDQPK